MPQRSSALLQVSTPQGGLFSAYAHERGAVWLDSALTPHRHSQKSLSAFRPVTELSWSASTSSPVSSAASLRSFLDEVERLVQTGKLTAIGYIAYEATLPFVGLAGKPLPAWLPGAHFFFYDGVDEFPAGSHFEDTPVEPRAGKAAVIVPARTAYTKSVAAIRRHIFEGDIYQANFTAAMRAWSTSSRLDVYQKLRAVNPAPYGAYLSFGDWSILSSSPELMFRRVGNRITTSPIKGTAPRPADPSDLQHAINQLLSSEKDRAELMMIVDLERNDLGKIARTGSVTVDHLVRPELYSSLIHLVSDISAELDPQVSFGDICEALLPGGSVTGAPKKRAVEILLELESQPRGVYCGYIGCLTPERAEFNLAIRTMTWHDGIYEIHAGGGIVADSEPEAEYEEMLLKSNNLLRAVGLEE